MSRSVRDLRELICMSRLSYHGDEIDQTPDDVPKETKTASELSTTRVSQKKVLSPVSPPRTPGSSGRGSPLPPIGKSQSGSSSGSLNLGRSSPLSPCSSDSQAVVRPISSTTRNYRPVRTNFDSLMTYFDASIIGEWLTRANKTVSELTTWAHSGDTFINFANFWLNEVSPSKRGELIAMEYSIVMDEVKFAFGVGLQNNQMTEYDIETYMNAVLWEYPQRFSTSQNGAHFLNVLMCLCCGRKNNYRKLLSDVKCSTSNKQFVQFILATRAFAIVNLCSGVVHFYKQIHSLMDAGQSEASQGKEMCEISREFAFQAIQKGYVEVFKYFFLNFEFELELEQKSDSDQKSFLFATTVRGQEEMLRFLLKESQLQIDLNKRSSSSGNTPLHTAVNAGNLNIVRLLAESGADMNAWNGDCDGATPLHLAILTGNKDMVELLLTLGCDSTVKMGLPATITPLNLAQDLGTDEVVSVLENFKI